MGTQLAAILASPWVTKACHVLHQNKALGVEVLGVNLPRTAIVRTKNEAFDVGFNEYGNTVGFFGGMWAGAKMLDKAMARMRIPIGITPQIINRGRVMKSFAMIPPLVAFMVGMPFIRNAFTAWRTGTTDFKELITLKGKRLQTPEEKEKNQAAIQRYLKIGGSIMLGGLALGVAGFFMAKSDGLLKIFRPNSSRLVPLLDKPLIKKALKAVCLNGEKASQLGDLHAVFYWGIPCYLSWMAASRDVFEVKEQFLKMLNFIGVYLLTEKGVGFFMRKKTAQLAKQYPQLYPDAQKFSYKIWNTLKNSPRFPQKIVQFENMKLLSGFGMTVLLMAILPAFLNIYLTRNRIARSQAASQAPLSPLPRNPFLQTSPIPLTAPLENMTHSGYSNVYRQ